MGGKTMFARDIVWARADTVLWRRLGRIRRRIRMGEELWPGTGNRETIRNAIFQRDPLILSWHGRIGAAGAGWSRRSAARESLQP